MKLYLKLIIFGLVVSFLSSISFGFATNCKDPSLASTVTDGSRSSHNFTCESDTSARKASLVAFCKQDGSESRNFTQYTCTAGFVCHRCECPSGTTWQSGKCAAPTPVTPTAADCKAKTQILSNGACIACVAPQVPNAGGTACETPSATTPATPTCNPDSEQLDATTNKCVPKQQTISKCAKDQKVDKCVCDEAAAMKSINGVCKSCDDPDVCCGVKLNTNVPFVGKCIRTDKGTSNSTSTVVTPESAFPTLMAALTKIMTTIILLICFGGILAGGVMIASSGGSPNRANQGKELIGKVVIAIALLGASGIILHLINPNFFG